MEQAREIILSSGYEYIGSDKSGAEYYEKEAYFYDDIPNQFRIAQFGDSFYVNRKQVTYSEFLRLTKEYVTLE